jgi:cellobiose phosphorylase
VIANPAFGFVDPGVPSSGHKALLDPCIPRTWRSFEIVFRYHSTRYDIVVENPQGVARGSCLWRSMA